jgi:dihydroxyacetone kinase
LGNYTGDRLTFEAAAEDAADEGIVTATVLVTDDVASAPVDRANERRGVAGFFFVCKCAGAAAERGDDLTEVARLAALASERTRSAAVGISPTVMPLTGRPSFDLPEGQMEIGVGIHGEPGTRRGDLEPADVVADRLFDMASAELDLVPGRDVAVLVNGLGATPVEEQLIILRQVHARIALAGVSVHRSYVGNFATSLEMAGVSLSLLLLDDELRPLLDAPASSPFLPL